MRGFNPFRTPSIKITPEQRMCRAFADANRIPGAPQTRAELEREYGEKHTQTGKPIGRHTR